MALSDEERRRIEDEERFRVEARARAEREAREKERTDAKAKIKKQIDRVAGWIGAFALLVLLLALFGRKSDTEKKEPATVPPFTGSWQGTLGAAKVEFHVKDEIQTLRDSTLPSISGWGVFKYPATPAWRVAVTGGYAIHLDALLPDSEFWFSTAAQEEGGPIHEIRAKWVSDGHVILMPEELMDGRAVGLYAKSWSHPEGELYSVSQKP